MPEPVLQRSASLTPEAFATHFEASARILWTLAAGVLADRHLVEDVLQEAAVIGLEKLHQFQPDTSYVAWMGRIVRYVALNHARRRARREELHADADHLEIAPDGDGTPGGLEPFDDELRRALLELKPTARACLLLKTVLELEYSEISRVLDVAPGTAMSHVHRARAALRARLSPPSPAPLRLMEDAG